MGTWWSDHFLPLSGCTSPAIFDLFALALKWILHSQLGWKHTFHYHDGCLTIFPQSATLSHPPTRYKADFSQICSDPAWKWISVYYDCRRARPSITRLFIYSSSEDNLLTNATTFWHLRGMLAKLPGQSQPALVGSCEWYPQTVRKCSPYLEYSLDWVVSFCNSR